jgi:hypothetical protein
MRLLAPALLLCACSNPAPTDPEGALRYRLGIPADAKTVIILSQNAHLDVDWQKTFDGYYQSYVGSILSEARDLLAAQPRAHYSIAEMAYLERFLDENPGARGDFTADAKRGAFPVVGCGMTSPDTLLPET